MSRPREASSPDDRSHTRALARGTVLAAIGKATNLVNPLAMLVFARLYGAETLGIYVLLVAYATVASRATIAAMPKTLQRFVPTNPDDAHAIVRAAIGLSVGLGTVAALLFTVAAPALVGLIQVGDASGTTIAPAVVLCSWTIPLRALLRVPLNAVRAKQQFGPDIYVRSFLEPVIWLAAGILFYIAGWGLYGLLGAKLLSLAITASLALGVLARRFEPALLLHPRPISRPGLWTEMFRFSAVTVTYDVVHYLGTRLDLLLLGALLSGPTGAAALGAYAVARTLSVPVVAGRKSIDYAVAPIASDLHARSKIDHLRDSYAATTRWNLCTFVPIITSIVTLRTDLLALFGAEFTTAATALAFLCIGRAIDEMTGPTALILAMIGRPMAPLLNDLAALAVSAALLYALVPTFGINGAALVAAAATAATSIAAHVEIRLTIGIQPYDRRIVGPLAVSAAGIIILLAARGLLAQTGFEGPWNRISLTVLWAAAFIVVFLRHALPAEDRALAGEGFERLRRRIRSYRTQSDPDTVRVPTNAR